MPIPTRPLPSAEELHRRFSYDASTGLLYWKACPEYSVQWNAKVAGKKAGGISKSQSHMVVNIKGRLMLVHRIIWKMVNGTEPAEIDHKDGDPTNNRIENLRPATRHQNMQNQRRHSGKLLPKGVTLRRRSGKFRADIFLNGRQKYLGEFNSPEIAHAVYCEAAAIRAEFARFD